MHMCQCGKRLQGAAVTCALHPWLQISHILQGEFSCKQDGIQDNPQKRPTLRGRVHGALQQQAPCQGCPI